MGFLPPLDPPMSAMAASGYPRLTPGASPGRLSSCALVVVCLLALAGGRGERRGADAARAWHPGAKQRAARERRGELAAAGDAARGGGGQLRWPLESFEGVTCGAANENEALRVRCDDGVRVKEVLFAVYGLPIDTEDEKHAEGMEELPLSNDFIKGASMHACARLEMSRSLCPNANQAGNVEKAIAVVNGLCAGRSTCRVDVSRRNFDWDPCFGTIKRLAVVLRSEGNGTCRVKTWDGAYSTTAQKSRSDEDTERCAEDLKAPLLPREFASVVNEARPVPADFRYPKVHVYDMPPEFCSCTAFRSCDAMRDAIKDSRYHTEDPSKADFFILPYTMAEGDVQSDEGLVRAFKYVGTRFPYLNRSIAEPMHVGPTHFIFTLCDHGPGDCLYERPLGRQTQLFESNPWAAPNTFGRKIGFLTLSGVRDGVDGHDNGDAYLKHCVTCFIRGIDIRISQTQHHECGPLCGYGLSDLHEQSPWARHLPESEDAWIAEVERDRPTTVFWTGANTPTAA